MKVLTARVVDGKIDIGHDLQEGATVAVIALEPGAPVLTAEDERELAESLAEIRSGEYVDGYRLLAELKARDQR